VGAGLLARPVHVRLGSGPGATWLQAGAETLKAAGLETVQENEARNTWFEIPGQSMSAMGRAISAVLRREANCESGVSQLLPANPPSGYPCN
jgi:hypothetical protein